MSKQSEINIHTTIELDAPVERLWPLLSDTDRVNRVVGLPAFERTEPAADLTQIVRSHYQGIPVSWREYPFEWVFEQWFQVERVFAEPLPIERIVTGTRLLPLPGDRTRAEVWVQITPRNAAGWLISRAIIARRMLRSLQREYQSLGRLAQRAAQVTPPAARAPSVNSDRLEQAGERLLSEYGLPRQLIELLSTHLRSADDAEVLRMRPFALADRWGVARLEVLRLFLYATRVGLLDLEWDVICPNCRGISVRTTKLLDLEQNAHCTSCNVRYDVNFDESVELRFSVHSGVREAFDTPFCIGGPANTRHILSQLWLPPRSSKELRLRLPEGTYRIRSRQLASVGTLDVGEGAQAAHIRIAPDAIDVDSPDLGSGEALLTLENATDESLLVILEQSAWSVQAASAALVTALAEFRQLFSSEVLAPGLGVSIRNLTFLFSDLKDSTMIYDTIGDSPAFARVRDHFDVMQRIIGSWRGTLVKTIGDAVMAVFPAVNDAVEASLEIQREFTMGQIARGNPSLKVKLGLHRGACIAVNANGLLDYFGSTVNIAARVQSTSVGGDIVVTQEVLLDPEVQRVIERAAPDVETFERELKGFSQMFTLYRLWTSAPEDADGAAALDEAQLAGR